MASIKKRDDGRWRARYRGPDGRERAKHFDRKVDAEAWVTEQESAKLRGSWRDPALGRMKFRSWSEDVEGTRVDRRASTRARDATLLRTRVLPTFGDQPLAAITTQDVKRWVANLSAAGLAPTTIRKCYQLAARVLDEAALEGLIAASPCQRITLPTDDRDPLPLVTPEQVEGLAAAIDDRYRALVLTAAYTGLRWGELAGLRLPRVDFLRRRIDVAEILTEVDGVLAFGPPKTSKSRGTVSFPAFLADELGAHVGKYPDPDRDRGLVFTSEDGTPLRRSNFGRRAWAPAAVAAGIGAYVKPARGKARYEGATFHSLRHACASWLIHAGANPLEVAEKLRHSRVTTTLATYGHLFPGTDERLDGLLEMMRVRTSAS